MVQAIMTLLPRFLLQFLDTFDLEKVIAASDRFKKEQEPKEIMILEVVDILRRRLGHCGTFFSVCWAIDFANFGLFLLNLGMIEYYFHGKLF